MQPSPIYGIGGVLSADIAVPEHEREQAFYAAILTTGDAPLWREDLTNNLGTPVIGLGKRTPDLDALPLQWMPHIQVADVAASVAHAVDLGGTEVMHGKTEEGQSQWAVLTDPGGATFGVIPVVPDDADAAAQQERQGCIAGLTLTVPDAEASRDFYQQVVGWAATSLGSEDGSAHAARYGMQTGSGAAVAEIRQRHDGGRGVPSVWLLHFPVGDLAESLRRVIAGGGVVMEQAAHHAVVRDPVGVVLALQAA
ncbi:MAG: VOC family protein [Bacteroidota bacterium]